ncbi:MAG: hypothetical protein GTN36_01680 [Candidatus Aenigmarchaeota archaeon]|nr:hypothetical protein [Candidatus Aenigmarchaeota archaeon]
MVEILCEGTGASPGKAQGKVRVINSVKDLEALEKGDVLVVEDSNPAWTIGMTKANAIVVEVGGIICHTAIIAREMSIPCVVGIKNATKILEDGLEILVDGNNGKIYRTY